jgi:hypothetical protein
VGTAREARPGAAVHARPQSVACGEVWESIAYDEETLKNWTAEDGSLLQVLFAIVPAEAATRPKAHTEVLGVQSA